MADTEDAESSGEEDIDLKEPDDTTAIVARWEERGITVEQLQILATSKDFHAAHMLERIAHNMMHKNSGGIGLSHAFLRSKDGVAVAKAVKDLLTSASTLRNSGITKQIQKDQLARQEELLDEKHGGKPVDAEVKSNPLLSRIEQMKKEAEAS